jgi:molybdate transport repressor ModE-like protein
MTPKTLLSIRIDSVVGKIGAKQIAFLEAIQSQGSITGAGRFTGLSYPGARLMIDAINKALREPAVSTTIGGHKRGGATLTRVGTQLVDCTGQSRCVLKPWRCRNVKRSLG